MSGATIIKQNQRLRNEFPAPPRSSLNFVMNFTVMRETVATNRSFRSAIRNSNTTTRRRTTQKQQTDPSRKSCPAKKESVLFQGQNLCSSCRRHLFIFIITDRNRPFPLLLHWTGQLQPVYSSETKAFGLFVSGTVSVR